MTAPAPGAPRFVTFLTIDDEPRKAGAEADALLDHVRELSAFGIGLTRCTEILDCGAEADQILKQGVLLDETRLRFGTVFRGEDSGVDLRPVEFIPENGGGAECRCGKPQRMSN